MHVDKQHPLTPLVITSPPPSLPPRHYTPRLTPHPSDPCVPSPLPHPSPPLADDLDDALLHGGGVQAAVGGASHNLVQQEVGEVLVGHEAPQVHLQVVAVHLDLLQAEAAEGPQPHALQERLQTDLYDARQHRHRRGRGRGEGGRGEEGKGRRGEKRRERLPRWRCFLLSL